MSKLRISREVIAEGGENDIVIALRDTTRTRPSITLVVAVLNTLTKAALRPTVEVVPVADGGFKENGGEMSRLAVRHRASKRAGLAVEMRGLLEGLVDGLPRNSRVVFVLHDVEGMSTEETAVALDISNEGVRDRLQKARAAFMSGLTGYAQSEIRKIHSFQESRCDRVVNKVLEQIQRSKSSSN